MTFGAAREPCHALESELAVLLTRISLALALTSTLLGLSPVAAQTPRPDLEQRLRASLEGMKMEGKFNVFGPNGMSAPQQDLYMVSKLLRGEGDTWLFEYAMSFNQSQKMVPIPVDVLWAGETPVLTITNQPIEGLTGSFTVRLLIFDGKYAGTWQHGPVGGHMWGVLVKEAASEP